MSIFYVWLKAKNNHKCDKIMSKSILIFFNKKRFESNFHEQFIISIVIFILDT